MPAAISSDAAMTGISRFGAALHAGKASPPSGHRLSIRSEEWEGRCVKVDLVGGRFGVPRGWGRI